MNKSSTLFAIVIIFTIANNCKGKFVLLRLNDVENARTNLVDSKFQNERGTYEIRIM